MSKLSVPKYGDLEEFPLTPSEDDEIIKYFEVEIEYPESLFFRMISTYLLRSSFMGSLQKLDDYFYKFPALRKLSYRQYICLS